MKDWTLNPITHRSNSSELFLAVEREIGRILRGSAASLIAGRTDDVAGLILAQLAHRYGFSPENEEETWKVLNGQ